MRDSDGAAACALAASLLPLVLIDRPVAPVVRPSAQPAEIRLVSSDSAGLVLDVTTGPIRRSAAEAPAAGFDRVAIAGAGTSRVVGAPRVPVVGTLIGIPAGAEAKVEVLAIDAGAIYQGVSLEPVALPTVDGDSLSRPTLRFEIDSQLYARDAYYPGVLAEIGEKARLRNQEVALLRVYPVRYNPARATLRHHTRMRLRIRFVRPPGIRTAAAPSGPSSPVFDRLLERLLINPPSVTADGKLVSPPRFPPGWQGQTGAPHKRSRAITASTLPENASVCPCGPARRPDHKGKPRPSTGCETSTHLTYDPSVESLPLATPGSSSAPASAYGACHPGGNGAAPTRLKLGVEADGLYQVSGAQLQAAGLEIGSVDPRKLRLLEGGREMAIRVVGEEDGILDPGDTVEFFGRGMKTEFTRRNVYVLKAGTAAGLRISDRDVTPSGRAAVQTTHFTTLHAEDGSSEYWQPMPDGDGLDHYFWRRLFSPSTHPFVLKLPHATSTDAIANLRVALHGRTDPAQDPDHHTKVILNGKTVDDQLWNGQAPFLHKVSFRSLLKAGSNTVAIELVDDTGADVDSLYLDFIEIDYTAELAAEDGVLRFVGDESGASRSRPTEYRLSNFTEATIELYEVSDPLAVVRCVGGRVSGSPGSYDLAFEDPTFDQDMSTPREYFAVGVAARRSPASIEIDAPSELRATSNGADYIVISHQDFLGSMTPLLDLRASQGLRTFAVDVADVYDEFSFGVFDPTAIRDFIRYAYERWQPPAPTFVVLVGDANQDYLDHLGTGTPDFLPTHLFETRFYGEFPEDNFYAAVSGDDILPDVLLGRIPVRTAASADAVVAKIVSYETTDVGSAWNRDVLLVADGEPGGFAAAQDALAASFLPPPFTTSRVFVDEFPQVNLARARLLAEIGQGVVLASYLGHGSVGNWSRERLLASADVRSLQNRGKYPFITSLDCIDGYYPHPSIPFSLAETLLNADGKGAVAVWSPTGVGFLSEYVSIGEELYKNLFVEGETRIGAATVDAVTTAFVNSTASSDNLRDLVLFGDPATRLALNRDTDDTLDRDDNCPMDFNPGQEDIDGDGKGDVCDDDENESEETNE